jgi:hypothetical protein
MTQSRRVVLTGGRYLFIVGNEIGYGGPALDGAVT